MALIESVPNISEGARRSRRGHCRGPQGRPGLHVLDVQSDATHNRSVLTLAGDPLALRTGILRLFERAVEVVDLRTHRGEHPRLGAVDVVPSFP